MPDTNDTSNTIYQLKISLKYIKPMIWRRIQVPADCTFQDLHSAIQSAMGWHNCHLHVFRQRDPVTRQTLEIGVPHDDGFAGLQEIIPEDTVKLCEILRAPKAKLMYLYDFGDGWQHNIVLEKILPQDPNSIYPLCLAGKRACPPEDCGGVNGYENHVEILGNPRHPEYKDHMEWLSDYGGATDLEAFVPSDVLFF